MLSAGQKEQEQSNGKSKLPMEVGEFSPHGMMRSEDE